MFKFVSALAALLQASAVAPAASLPVRVMGRSEVVQTAGYRFGWPGVYFEGSFKGDAVAVAVDAGDDNLEVLVDGVSQGVLHHPGSSRHVFTGLGPGEHVVRLQKLGESQTGSVGFMGFFAGRTEQVLPAPAARARQIEIIGDSYSVGYGDTSTKRTCTPAEIHDTTNTQLAYGPLAARRLGADYRVNAYSGYGVVRNYDGHDPGSSLPLIYDRLIPGDPARLDAGDPAWRPQLMVVALGTNDFSTPVHAGERWTDNEALRADYRAAYTTFLRKLSARQPQARFVLLAHTDWAAQVQAAARAFDPDGRRVRVLPYAGLELTGCDWHPSAHDQARLADALVQAAEGFVSFPPADHRAPEETSPPAARR